MDRERLRNVDVQRQDAARDLTAEHLKLILSIIRHASRATDPAGFFTTLVDAIYREIKSFSHVGFLIRDPQHGRLQLAAVAGELDPGMASRGESPTSGILVKTLARGRAWRAESIPAGSMVGQTLASLSRSALCIPIRTGGEITALLNLESREPGAFTAQHETLFEILCEHLGDVLQGMDLNMRIREKSAKIQRSTEICRRVLSAASLREALDIAVRLVVEEFGWYGARVAFIVDEGKETVHQAFHARDQIEIHGGFRQAVDGGLLGRVARDRKTVVCLDTAAEPAYIAPIPGVASELCIPLLAGESLVGVLEVYASVPRAFDDEDVGQMESLARQLALLIEKAGHLERTSTTRDFLENLIASAGDGILALDRAGHITRWNLGMERLLGRTASEVLGHRLDEVSAPGAQSSLLAALQRAMLGEEVVRLETTSCREDGARVDLALTVSPIRGAGGGVEGISAIVRDITEHHRMEEGLRRATSEREALHLQLIQSEKLSALGQLISGVAHELNNPLTGVIGYSQLLASQDCDEKTRRGLDKVYSEARRCHRIVQNLLTFARKHTPEKSSISVNEILESILELRSYQMRVDNITVSKDLSRDLPRTMGDFHQLQQVFMNIVINAHQAMQESGGGGAMIVRSSTDDSRILVEICDDGPGIPKEIMNRVFDPFFTTKPTGQGTGLGLSICYGIIQEHDGGITVVSVPGATSFRVDLPVISNEIAGAARAELSASTLPGLETSGDAAPRVLVVDDEPSIVEVVTETLRGCGYVVEAAVNGREALNRMASERYDIVLSDLKMPEMGGRELFEQACLTWPGIESRFVFSTGDVIAADTREFLERSGTPWIEKPFELEKLKSTVRNLLRAPAASVPRTVEKLPGGQQ